MLPPLVRSICMTAAVRLLFDQNQPFRVFKDRIIDSDFDVVDLLIKSRICSPRL